MGASRPQLRLRRCLSQTGLSSSTTLGEKTKWPHKGAILLSGGEGGIRTHGTGNRTPDFESGPFDHSGTPPFPKGVRALFEERALTPLGLGGDIGKQTGVCQVRKVIIWMP
jgi:hypothetical protein